MEAPSSYDLLMEEAEAGYFSVLLPERTAGGEPFVRQATLGKPTPEAIDAMFSEDEDDRVALMVGFMWGVRQESGCPTPPHTSSYAPEED